ncbi:MAG: thymidine phosphorylase, partial [Clostridia bacterium]|nr:thymidine phosphorylase [Clostridia bacterium]
MRAVDLIEKKKRNEALSEAELRFLIEGYTKGEIADYQMSAWAMAVCFRGMTREETAALTAAMAESGDQVDLSALGDATVDKHSTGGVGDKTSLIVAPLVASLGGKVAKMSGRGLGHTGGTVDKLESIPGYQTTLSAADFMAQAQRVGIVVAGQSGNLAPADKKLYALRDVTATVDSVPLIASSIMSKKLAAGARSIVLDVKTGSGAFMKTAEDSIQLAEEMVRIGTACGRRVSALITNMDLPLGQAIGNAAEVEEAIAVLRGKGPADLREVCLALASEMLILCRGWSKQEAMEKATAALDSGLAYQKFEEWITAQGGDLERFWQERDRPIPCRLVC